MLQSSKSEWNRIAFFFFLAQILSKTQTVSIKSKEDVKLHVADKLWKSSLTPASMLLGHTDTEETSTLSTSALPKLGRFHPLQKSIFWYVGRTNFHLNAAFWESKTFVLQRQKVLLDETKKKRKEKITSSINIYSNALFYRSHKSDIIWI